MYFTSTYSDGDYERVIVEFYLFGPFAYSQTYTSKYRWPEELSQQLEKQFPFCFKLGPEFSAT